MLIFAIVLLIIFFKLDLPETTKAIIISVVGGILIFDLIVLFSKITSLDVGNKPKKEKTKEEKERKRKRIYKIAFILMIISIPIFFNFYLYIKALVGNDLLISLDTKDQNFVLKNGEEQGFNVKAKVLINPFCSANCSITLKDLAKDSIVDYENMYIGVSTPFSKNYLLRPEEDKFGKKLYKLTLECNTIREQRFCYVNSDLSKFRTEIISVNYELNEAQKIKKEELKNKTEEINREFYNAEIILNKLNFSYSSLNLSEAERKSNFIKESSNSILLEINELNTLYEKQEYSIPETKISSIKEKVDERSVLINELNTSLINTLTYYNLIIDNLSSMHEDLLLLEEYNFTNSSISAFEAFIIKFNSVITEIKKKDTLENKILLFNQLKADEENILLLLQNESIEEILGDQKIQIPIHPMDIEKILIDYANSSSNFSLSEPPPICCFNKECYSCLDDSSSNYPVILVHGHSFNEKLSAELSMEAFSDMALTLEKDGYLNAGYFYESQYDEISKGYLGGINNPVVVEVTYYIDTLVTDENSFILDSKWESINTYASRLNEIVYNVKYLTGKDKVIIVAHSMGCLVTRSYMQTYGEENLDKVILVGGPNHGIDGFILKSCPVFGADIECSEMNKNSSFMAELNNASLPNIPVYNIIGIGCPIEGVEGDGIVKNESSFLEGAENIYVNGTCSRVDFFHVRMIKPSYHPEIYEIIKSKI